MQHPVPTKRPQATTLVATLTALALLGACAIVDSIESGLGSVGRWADGFFAGEGEVVDGEQQGPHVYTYEDGGVRARYQYLNDKRHGPAETFYRDQTKESEGQYVDQQRSGRWTYYHPNGRVRSQGAFRQDREFGEWMFWSTRGDPTQRGHYNAGGLPSLVWSYWHPDGALESRGFFLRNERVGLWSFWDREGNLTQDWHELPDGYEAVLEKDSEGKVRREGFLVNGRQHGTWVTRHASGEVRATGTYENGTPHGPWRLQRDGGVLLAKGEMELGRAVGSWTVHGDRGPSSWSAAGVGPPPRFTGEWSPASIADSGDFGQVLGMWVAEASADVAEEAIQKEVTEPEAPAPSVEQVAVAEAEPDVPILVQPWTPKQIEAFDTARLAYLEGGAAQQKLSSRYAKRGNVGGAEEPGNAGRQDLAQAFLGKPLPLTKFRDEVGNWVDVAELTEQRILLIVLRGFDGEFCPYCAAQTDALAESWVCERIEELDTKVVIVFPGDRNAEKAFLRGYESISRRDRIPPFFRFFYERDAIVSADMDLEGDRVTPATFLLDEDRIVRFAYIGDNPADRPSIDRVIEELERLGTTE